ncbi:mandelate racemase [Candidatus Poribacteria bacterium]|nr:mandelate racemase [Candidatus Poribacteria bacterium]
MSQIVKVEIGRFDYDVVGEFKFFKPGPDGHIRRPSVLIRLTDENGVKGWGQAVPTHTWTYETVETVETTLAGYLAEVLLGTHPENIDDIHTRMNQAIRPAFSVGQPLCKAAVDLACYDLVGKQTDRSVSEILGPNETTSLTLSWTVASPDMRVVEEQLENGRAQGYRNFNIKVGAPQTPKYDLALARRVREFAPEGFLWADANTGYTTDTALEIMPKLADAGVDVLESPLPPTHISGYQALKRLGALPILMDEGILSPVEVAEFIALNMLDGIAMKPARNAGIRPSEQIIRLLKERNLMVLGSGLTDPDLSLAASAHLFAWAGINYPCALNGPQFLVDGLSGETLVPDRDQLHVPTGPGLGVELDSRAEAALSVVAER